MIRRLFRNSRKNKVFCIGRNKTGTTSLGAFLQDLGYRLAPQPQAELMIEDWAIREFRRIVAYTAKYDAFQDLPYSLDYTYEVMDFCFPKSKYILSVRENADVWFESLLRYHSELIGGSIPPAVEDVKKFAYRRKGFLYRNQILIYGASDATLYDPKLYKEHYERHNARVMDYFRHRPDDLLVVDLSRAEASSQLCQFLEVDGDIQVPHLNRGPSGT